MINLITSRFQLPPFETEDPSEQLQLIKEATQRHGVGLQQKKLWLDVLDAGSLNIISYHIVVHKPEKVLRRKLDTQVRAKLRGDEMWQPDEPQVRFFYKIVKLHKIQLSL